MSFGCSSTENEFDLVWLRARICMMTDADLIREIQAGEYMCSPQANFGGPPLKVFVIQLREAWAEWNRRRKDHCRPRQARCFMWRGAASNSPVEGFSYLNC